MTETMVWAFQPVPELGNELGFVACDHALADKLIASGDVQDPRVGALHFKEIEPTIKKKSVRQSKTRGITVSEEDKIVEGEDAAEEVEVAAESEVVEDSSAESE
jgi:hypothetical protein